MLRTYQGALRAFLCRLTRDAALADDLAQDTFLRAYQKMGQLRDPDAAKSWLYQCAYRLFCDQARKTKRRTQLGLARLEPEPVAAPTGLRHDLESAMNALSADQRAVIMLCYVQGFSQSEVAKITGQPLGTVKSHCTRGKAQLAALLSDYAHVM